MARIAVVTDSTAYLPPELVKLHGIHVIPLQLHMEGETLRDGVTIDPPTFYERLSRSADVPTTSQPSVGEFADFFTDAAGTADGIVGVFISDGLSGTVASALAARDFLPALSIEVVDSRFTSMGLGFITLAAARAAAEGKSLSQVAAAARELVPRVNLLFVVDTLKYLHRGGRIGGAARLLGSALSIKPLLHLYEGRIDALGQTRTKRRAKARMLEVMAERVGNSPIRAAVVHASAAEEAASLLEEVDAGFDCVELLTAELSPAIGTHVGPGTVGVAFHTAGADCRV